MARRCPACQSKVGRDNLMCPSCGFVIPMDAPVVTGGAVVSSPARSLVGPRPAAAQRPFANASQMGVTGPPPILDIPIPATREWTGIFSLASVGFFFWIGLDGDPFAALIALAIAVGVVPPYFFSMFGWEHVVVTDTHLILQRVLFGRPFRRVEIERGRVASVEFFGDDAEGASGKKLADQKLWTYSEGPLMIEAAGDIYRLGQGLSADQNVGREVVDRLERELLGTQSA